MSGDLAVVIPGLQKTGKRFTENSLLQRDAVWELEDLLRWNLKDTR